MNEQELIGIIIELQKDAKDEKKAVKKKEVEVPLGLDLNGYKHYCEGWNDALAILSEKLK